VRIKHSPPNCCFDFFSTGVRKTFLSFAKGVFCRSDYK
jgi:hypothetical protein